MPLPSVLEAPAAAAAAGVDAEDGPGAAAPNANLAAAWLNCCSQPSSGCSLLLGAPQSPHPLRPSPPLSSVSTCSALRMGLLAAGAGAAFFLLSSVLPDCFAPSPCFCTPTPDCPFFAESFGKDCALAATCGFVAVALSLPCAGSVPVTEAAAGVEAALPAVCCAASGSADSEPAAAACEIPRGMRMRSRCPLAAGGHKRCRKHHMKKTCTMAAYTTFTRPHTTHTHHTYARMHPGASCDTIVVSDWSRARGENREASWYKDTYRTAKPFA